MKNFSTHFLSLVEIIKSKKNILIVIKGSPDPDVLASSYALKLILKNYEVKSKIIALKGLSLPQNEKFVEKLQLPIEFNYKIKNLSQYDGYAILDFQTVFVDNLTEKLPCLIHIDHHEKANEKIEVDFNLISKNVGSTSTILSLFLKYGSLKFGQKTTEKLYTALCYGIQTDTDKYEHAVDSDFEAFNFLHEKADLDLINKIDSNIISKKIIRRIHDMKSNSVEYKDWFIGGIGFLNEKERDSIAIISDFINEKKTHTAVIIFALIENRSKKKMTLDVSLRTPLPELNLDRVIKHITKYGGARDYKGAFQIKMNYFHLSPDKNDLWNLVKETTFNALKRERDRVHLSDVCLLHQSGIIFKTKKWLNLKLKIIKKS